MKISQHRSHWYSNEHSILTRRICILLTLVFFFFLWLGVDFFIRAQSVLCVRNRMHYIRNWDGMRRRMRMRMRIVKTTHTFLSILTIEKNDNQIRIVPSRVRVSGSQIILVFKICNVTVAVAAMTYIYNIYIIFFVVGCFWPNSNFKTAAATAAEAAALREV